MKHIIQLEELAQSALGIAVLYFLPYDFSWWVWIPIFLAPDISFLAYTAGTRTGAFVYNLFHHRGIAIAIGATGFFMNQDLLMFVGTLLFTHSSFDRMLGYGLKYYDNFKHTHLGWLK